MSDRTTNLMLPFLASAQAQKHVTVNESLRRLDALVQLAVVSATTSAEPGSPGDGEVYILPAGKNGAHWGAMTNLALAYYRDGAWEEIAPREGFSAYVKDTDKVLAYSGAAWVEMGSAALLVQRDAGQLQGFKNRLVNGGFAINQRVGASNADDSYCLDRWYVLTQSGAIAASQLTDPETGAPTGIRLSQSQASAQRMGLAQIIESANCRDLRSVVASLAGRLRCSLSQAINFAILEWTGTADSVTSDVVNDWTDAALTAGHFFVGSNVTVAATGSVTPAAATWADFALVNKAISASCTNLIVMVWTAGTIAQNATLDLNRVQLEPGATATRFELLPPGVELVRCQRFFEKSFSTATAPAQNVGAGSGETLWISGMAGANTAQGPQHRFAVEKRTAPTMTIFNPAAANAQVRDRSINADCSATAVHNTNTHGFAVNCTGHTSTSVGSLMAFHWTADAEL